MKRTLPLLVFLALAACAPGSRAQTPPDAEGGLESAALPPVGFVTFEDLETVQLVEFNTSGPEARAYRARVAKNREEREQLLAKLAVDYVNVRTDRPYVDALVTFFRARERRMRH